MTPTPLTENPAELSKMHSHFPCWGLTKSRDNIFSEIVHGWEARQITHREKSEKLQSLIRPNPKSNILIPTLETPSPKIHFPTLFYILILSGCHSA